MECEDTTLLAQEEEVQASKSSLRHRRCAPLLCVVLALAAACFAVTLLPHHRSVAVQATQDDIVELNWWDDITGAVKTTQRGIVAFKDRTVGNIAKAVKSASDLCVRMSGTNLVLATSCGAVYIGASVVESFDPTPQESESAKTSKAVLKEAKETRRAAREEAKETRRSAREEAEKTRRSVLDAVDKGFKRLGKTVHEEAEETRRAARDAVDRGIKRLSKVVHEEAEETRRLVTGTTKEVLHKIGGFEHNINEFEELYRKHERTHFLDAIQRVHNTFHSAVLYGHEVPPGFFDEHEALFDKNNLQDGVDLCGDDKSLLKDGLVPLFMAARTRLFATHAYWCSLPGEHNGRKCSREELEEIARTLSNDFNSYVEILCPKICHSHTHETRFLKVFGLSWEEVAKTTTPTKARSRDMWGTLSLKEVERDRWNSFSNCTKQFCLKDTL